MLTAQTAITEMRTRNRNTLTQKVTANASGVTWYRADYELRQLRRIKEITKRTMKLLMHARTCELFVQYSRELDRWMERERILLRIPLPQAAKAPEPRRVSSSVSYTDLPRSAPDVIDEATPAAQTTSNPGPGPAS